MPDFSFLPIDWQPITAVLFGLSMAVFAAWSRIFGKKEGPPAPKVQEFAVAAQLADMGPVRELVEQTGLLVQQQIMANIHAEAAAKAINRLAGVIEAQIEEAKREKEIAEEVQRQLRDKA